MITKKISLFGQKKNTKGQYYFEVGQGRPKMEKLKTLANDDYGN